MSRPRKLEDDLKTEGPSGLSAWIPDPDEEPFFGLDRSKGINRRFTFWDRFRIYRTKVWSLWSRLLFRLGLKHRHLNRDGTWKDPAKQKEWMERKR